MSATKTLITNLVQLKHISVKCWLKNNIHQNKKHVTINYVYLSFLLSASFVSSFSTLIAMLNQSIRRRLDELSTMFVVLTKGTSELEGTSEGTITELESTSEGTTTKVEAPSRGTMAVEEGTSKGTTMMELPSRGDK